MRPRHRVGHRCTFVELVFEQRPTLPVNPGLVSPANLQLQGLTRTSFPVRFGPSIEVKSGSLADSLQAFVIDFAYGLIGDVQANPLLLLLPPDPAPLDVWFPIAMGLSAIVAADVALELFRTREHADPAPYAQSLTTATGSTTHDDQRLLYLRGADTCSGKGGSGDKSRRSKPLALQFRCCRSDCKEADDRDGRSHAAAIKS
mmetsp:Transcript_73622/g.129966  ORF Transcript_73622/g.129966 Transcript_73622/m.129966 type:complete len:202 (+) Transcript_73622:380-985(+)